jgi:hypothetical protein
MASFMAFALPIECPTTIAGPAAERLDERRCVGREVAGAIATRALGVAVPALAQREDAQR